MISYTIKTLIQLTFGVGVAYIIGFRPSLSIYESLLVFLFVALLTLCSVGFGMITATLAKSASSAGKLTFIFIIPQQIFATFIPPIFLGAVNFAKFLPSYYTTDSLTLLFQGLSIYYLGIWKNLGILLGITLIIYRIGIILFDKRKNL